ncbi:AAA family ATPase, partial [Paeniroseomonas aquatica]|uniref:AAA family ATPase n=1 Tax=Paeniroseomonas aquatica TaxID=373043 RepID=UPI00361F7012
LSGLSPDGSGITQMLAFDDLEGGATLTSVSNWYLNATGHRVELRWGAFAGKELFSVVLTPEETRSVQLDIVDTGEGMGQVLPVIGALCFAEHNSMKRNSIIAVEHPELHLHPSAHPSLAQLFCKLASGTQAPTLVVETHSEIFLLSVQLAIVAGDLDPKSVVVYWVKSSESGSEPVKVEFDEQGRPIGDTASWCLFRKRYASEGASACAALAAAPMMVLLASSLFSGTVNTLALDAIAVHAMHERHRVIIEDDRN